jgi:hypothetical protein
MPAPCWWTRDPVHLALARGGVVPRTMYRRNP